MWIDIHIDALNVEKEIKLYDNTKIWVAYG